MGRHVEVSHQISWFPRGAARADQALFKTNRGTDRRRTWIIMLLYLCQQVTGVQFVLGYSTYFFELAGFTTSRAFALNVGTLSLAVSQLL